MGQKTRALARFKQDVRSACPEGSCSQGLGPPRPACSSHGRVPSPHPLPGGLCLRPWGDGVLPVPLTRLPSGVGMTGKPEAIFPAWLSTQLFSRPQPSAAPPLQPRGLPAVRPPVSAQPHGGNRPGYSGGVRVSSGFRLLLMGSPSAMKGLALPCGA